MSVTNEYGVTGMTCAHCVSAVTTELKALGGVQEVTIGLNVGGTSNVRVVSDGPLAETAVRDAVDEAGYQLATPQGSP